MSLYSWRLSWTHNQLGLVSRCFKSLLNSFLYNNRNWKPFLQGDQCELYKLRQESAWISWRFLEVESLWYPRYVLLEVEKANKLTGYQHRITGPWKICAQLKLCKGRLVRLTGVMRQVCCGVMKMSGYPKTVVKQRGECAAWEGDSLETRISSTDTVRWRRNTLARVMPVSSRRKKLIT